MILAIIFFLSTILFVILWLRNGLKHDSFIASLYKQETDRFWEEIRKSSES